RAAADRGQRTERIPRRVALNPFPQFLTGASFGVALNSPPEVVPPRWPEPVSVLGRAQRHQSLRMLGLPFKSTTQEKVVPGNGNFIGRQRVIRRAAQPTLIAH